MTVIKSQRSESKLAVHVELRKLIDHTFNKTRNSKKFSSVKTYMLERDDSGNIVSITETKTGSKEALARRIENAAILAGECAWRANGIRVGKNGEGYETRLQLQNEAIRNLEALTYLVNTARKICSLTGKETKYWIDAIGKNRSMVAKWRDSDRKRYALH